MDPEVKKTTLDNGVRIVSRVIPHVYSVSMGVWVNIGARDETLSENGLSHFIEHMIFKGTEKRSGYQIAKEFDAVGGQTNAFTAMENTCYHAKVVDRHLATMVDILSDIFLNSTFSQSEVEKERPVIIQEIGMVEDAPDEYVHQLAGSNLWGDNPLGRSILGTRDNILGFDAGKIRDFFQRRYRPDCMVISLAGNFDHDQFVDLIAPSFGSVLPGDDFIERITPPGRFSVDLNYRHLEQMHLCMTTTGLPITAPERYTASLINTIFGGNMSSRLFQEIRERQGLAYAVYSFMSSHIDTGMFGIYAGVAPQKVQHAVELILKEIHKLKNEPVGDTELQAAKDFTRGNILLAAESVDNQMVRLAQNEIHFGRNIPIEEIMAGIDSVSRQDILELAARLFDTERLALTLLGPLENPEPFEAIMGSRA